MFSSQSTDIGRSFGVQTAVSPDMEEAINRWKDEYHGRAYWLKENPQTLDLPAFIASEIATLVTLEAEITITGSARASWLMKQFEPVIEHLRINTEYACAFGGIVMKPAVDDGGIAVDYVQAGDFYPVEVNGRREITAAVFVESKQVGRIYYNRVEYHRLYGKTYTIENRCFRSYGASDGGQEVSLTEVDEWKDIAPHAQIDGVEKPLFAYFRIPIGNTIDAKSPLGVSVYAAAEKNMREADKQYQRLLWEYEAGEMAIDASEDTFATDENGDPKLPAGKERLYRLNDLDPRGSSDGIFKTFSPALRDEAYARGLDKILRNIENNVVLSHGTIAPTDNTVKTATEIIRTQHKTYSRVKDIQTQLGNTLESLAYAMDVLATLYNLAPAGSYTLNCNWDDSVITDCETERMHDKEDVRDGIMQKWEFRMKWYGEDEETARARINEGAQTDDEILFGKKTEPPTQPGEKVESEDMNDAD